VTLEEAQEHLRVVSDAVDEQFDVGLHESRLAQFHALHATTVMALQHLYDEEVRHNHHPRAHQRAIGAYVPEE
jgi:hypothetical protein